MTLERIEGAHLRLNRFANVMGSLLVDAFHQVALFAIGGTIVWSAVHTFGGKIEKTKFSIGQYGFISLVRDTEGTMIGLYSRK